MPQCHQSDVQVLGKMALGALAHAPRQRQGAPCIDHVDHPRRTAAPHDTAIHHQHERLSGSMRQEDLGIRYKGHLLQDARVVEPSGTAFDAALGLGALGHFGGDGGPLRALAAHDAADEGGEGLHMSGEVACGRSRIGLREGVANGPIAAKVVTHRPFLLLLV